MAKEIKDGVRPMSKYAAKKAANAKATIEGENSVNTETTEVKKKFNRRSKSPFIDRYPEHITNLVLLMKNNAEIRRFTALGIINRLTQTGVIGEGKKYVTFRWNKFTVYVNGFGCDYAYSEKFFLESLVASFVSFSNAAQRIINIFCKEELKLSIGDSVDTEEIDNIIKNNEEHIDSQIESGVE